MVKYRLIHKHLLINKPIKDVIHAITNSFNAFKSDIVCNLSSLDSELHMLRLTNQTKLKVLDLYVTIIINSRNENQTQTQLEFLVSYKSSENILRALIQKRKMRWVLNNFLLEFKIRCEKWL